MYEWSRIWEDIMQYKYTNSENIEICFDNFNKGNVSCKTETKSFYAVFDNR